VAPRRLAGPRADGVLDARLFDPVFVLGYLLIWLVSLKLGWLPVQGYVVFPAAFIRSSST
jgi:hypothetical protein